MNLDKRLINDSIQKEFEELKKTPKINSKGNFYFTSFILNQNSDYFTLLSFLIFFHCYFFTIPF